MSDLTEFGKRVATIKEHADSLGWIDESNVGEALADSDAPLWGLVDKWRQMSEFMDDHCKNDPALTQQNSQLKRCTNELATLLSPREKTK